MSEHTTQSRVTLVMEIRANEWRGSFRNRGFVVPIQRDELGQLNAESLTQVKEAIRHCVGDTKGSEIKCLCALASGGISLRSIEVPASKGVPLKNLLELQIEKEWPLPPADLAWGFQSLTPSEINPESQENNSTKVAIAAVKRSLFRHYETIVKECGLEAKWTLGACAGSMLPEIESASHYRLLDLRETHSELIEFENGIPSALRSLSLGWNAISSPQNDEQTGYGAEAADRESVDEAAEASAIQPLINALNADESRAPLGIAGQEPWLSECLNSLQAQLPNVTISSHGIAEGEAACFVTQVLGKSRSPSREARLIELKSDEDALAPSQTNRTPLLRWVALLVLLVILALLTRRIEPALRSSGLDAQLKQFNEQKSQLPELDRELSFMEHVAQKSLPYMDLISLLAAQTVPGFQLETLDMGSDRQIQIRGALPQNAQPEDLRAKLLSSGWFEQVVLDEQTPDKNKRNLTIRISLTVKPPLRRPALSEAVLGIESDTEPTEKPNQPGK